MVTNCIICNKAIKPHQTRKYCGSLKQKSGCAYKVRLRNQREIMQRKGYQYERTAKQKAHIQRVRELNSIYTLPDTNPQYTPEKHHYWFTN